MGWLQQLKPLSDVADKIGGFLFNLAWSKGTRLWNVEEEAEKLRRTEKRIRALLRDAEERRYIDDESVKLWLLELKSVAYDAETLLDRLTTFTAVARLESAEPSRKRKRSWLNLQLGPRQRWGLDAKITEINERLDEIARGRKRFKFQPGDAARRAQPGQRPRFVEVAACHDESSQIFGRAKEKEEVVQALLSDHTIPLPVISIYGAAGIGKTTLARLVYNNAEVQSSFPTRIWVCLSDKCDVTKATKMIMEAITKVKCDALSLDILQQQLQEHLSTTKFLLVIDNLWAEDYNFWELLRCPLLAGEKGSKVLITTRNERVWRRTTSTILPVHLKGLDDEECWLLLKKYAFLHGQGRENDALSKTGRMIAADCRGSPLAAKSLGMLLSDTNGEEEEWLNISNQMRILNEDNNRILPSLQISYHHLPYHLKQLFTLCCLFPVGHEFEKDEVIRLWIAEGLIQCNARRRLEAEAGRFFDELLWRSFFETSGSSTNQRYRVPSLMNELASLVSKSECLCIEPGNLQGGINRDLTLDLRECYRLTELPEELSRFTVTADAEGYCNMKELKDINIRGELCLLKLESATHENAGESKLSEKQYVENLMLQWSYNNNQAVDESMRTWCDSEEAELPKLKELYISHCPRLQNVTNLPQTMDIQQLQQLSALKRLKIGGFKQLSSVSDNSGMEALSSLEFLEISSCTELQRFSVVGLQSLKDFKLRHCTKLEALPTGLGNLGSLRCVEIHDIPNLRIDNTGTVLPDSVSYLTLSGCPDLESWCRNTGAQRVKKIPNVKIGF
ncbi:putative disease resistance RPP13-like protein 1 [Oryza glaberrima]|uniref:putative disease resistance RPP13-like protein 1 n=1 Tax=Oryza glaberrima TaxID=4538 RepID=UPI00224C19D2|nr:putative disease resistance RPP13-like protein 1 [Oryza glaberrima]